MKDQSFEKYLRVGDFRIGTERLHNVSSSKDVNLTLDLSRYHIDSISSVSTTYPWSPASGWIPIKYSFDTRTKVIVILVRWDIEIKDDTTFKVNYYSEIETKIENRDSLIDKLLGNE